MTKQEEIPIIRTTEQKKAHGLYLASLKQEEIREVIDTYTDDVCLYPDRDCEHHRLDRVGSFCVSADGSYNCLLKRLSKLGCVIKRDELPVITKKGHYYLVEPLKGE